MGGIIYWTIIRIAILIPLLWIATDYIEFIQYKLFREENYEVITNTLCSSCKHFDETAVLCLKYDEHPTEDKIPCEGAAWEPKL